MTVTFHVAHCDEHERTALDVEGAPTLNVHNAGAGDLLAMLDVPFDWCGEIDPQTVIECLDRTVPPPDAIGTARCHRLRAIAGTAARVGRNVAWD